MSRICIAGAGLAGLYLAIALGRRGHAVRVHERRTEADLARGLEDGGRSIALALSHRGLHALAALGIEPQALSMGRRMLGRRIHPVSGPTVFSPYDPRGDGRILAISRAELYSLLKAVAEHEPLVDLRFGDALTSWAPASAGVTAHFEHSGGPHHFDAVVGADGADSRTRHSLEALGPARFVRHDFAMTYMEVRLHTAGAPFDPAALHIWPRGSMMLIGLPGRVPGTLDGTIFLPSDALNPWFATSQVLRERFASEFPDLRLSSEQAEAVVRQPAGRIYTIEGGPWHTGPVVLVGDAAHAFTPFLGQGMNCALEDCMLLLACMDTAPDLSAAFRAFYDRRVDDAAAIGALSIANLEELMTKTQSPEYMRRKRLEAWLANRFPLDFVPQYTAITFDRVRYSKVLTLKGLQDALIDRLRAAGTEADSVKDDAIPAWVQAEVHNYGRQAHAVMTS